MKKKNYFIKGVYDHPQIGGYLTVKQYIMMEQDGKHCLLLRFENEMKRSIQAVAFTVMQLDSDGAVIASNDVKYTDLNLKSGRLFCPEEGIVLEKKCVDFLIRMRSLVSGETKYLFHKGQVTEHYDPRGYDAPRALQKDGGRTVIRRKYSGGGKAYGWMAFLSLLLMLASIWFTVYKTEADARKSPDSRPIVETQAQETEAY